MPQASLQIPLRTSSVNAPTGAMFSGNSNQDDMRSRKKAQKILGTADISLNRDYHKTSERKTGRRPSFLKAPEIKPKKSEGLALFPSKETHPSQSLRVRASSPLLGQSYRARQDFTPAVPEIPNKLRQSDSSSALYSHYSSRESTASSNVNLGVAANDLGLLTDRIPGPPNTELNSTPSPQKGTKAAKRKGRPPRIDLSLLFPKPQAGNAPLLSPQRLTSSPSQLSIVSEQFAARPGKSENRSPGRKLTKVPPTRVPAYQSDSHQKLNGVLNSPTGNVPLGNVKGLKWLEPYTEHATHTGDMAETLEREREQPPLRSADRARYSLLNFRSRSREHLQKSDSKSTKSAKSGKSTESSQTTSREVASENSFGDLGKDMYRPPRVYPGHTKHTIAGSPRVLHSGMREPLPVKKSPVVSKKSSRNTLKNSDLYHSSVLCLSSSEDEDDDEDEDILKIEPKVIKGQRDSVATFGDFEAEICTASAAQATKGTLRSLQRPVSTTSRDPYPNHKPRNTKRDSSASSASKPSVVTKGSESRRSSGIPAIFEPDFFHNDPIFSQMRNSNISLNMSQKEYNRRSRVIAVTRQEEHLLEAVRQRQGKITPSIFNETRYNGGLEPDQHSIMSGPSRDSFYCSDTSFLRLSPGLPPPGSAQPSVGAHSTDKGVPTSRGSSLSTRQKTVTTGPSPRASVAYSESLPSPATGGASPIATSLPIHRFSPLPSQKPPPRQPPPPVPGVQKQHSRRRTDSSEAIVLGTDDTPKDKTEFPIWALGWNNDTSNVTAVH